MIEELHEGTPQQLPYPTVREHPVIHRHEGQQEDETDAHDEFDKEISFSPAGETFVPYRC